MLTPYMTVEGLTKRVGDKVLFAGINFAVNKGERIALVARNGAGKSTLLDILTAHASADSGKITFRRDIRIGYLPQQIDYPPELATLSGGQKKKVMIDRLLDTEPDLLILDEPTNHLDLDTVAKLEDTLRKANRTILMVTHDRYFLDRVCDTIIELEQDAVYLYKNPNDDYGGSVYQYYLQKRAERIDNLMNETQRARNLYRTELEWMRRMPQARGHKAQYRIDRFYQIEDTAKRVIREDNVRLEMESGYIGNKIFEAKEVSKAFGDKIILDRFSYVFSRYEKLGIIGKNGTGKSTFLKLLLGELTPDSGSFDIGTTIRFGYYRQTGYQFEAGKKVIDIVRAIAETVDLGNGDRLTASQFLQHFLFTPQQQYDYVDKLSGGEKQRLHLCLVLMQSPNFLVLDEPTNDLDIPTLQILEEYLRAFRGCLIVVSHDRYFMDRVVDHLFVFRGEGQIDDFPGNYTQWRETTSPQPQNREPGTRNPEPRTQNREPKTGNRERQRRLSFKEKQELAELEKKMPLLEAEKQHLEQQLSGILTAADEIAEASRRYETLTAELDEAELRWLELSELNS